MHFRSNLEFSCTSHGDCSEENSCINGICKNPCDASEFNPCLNGQACQVKNHQPVCIKGNGKIHNFFLCSKKNVLIFLVCQCQKQSDCPKGSICNGCECIQRKF